MSMCLPLLCHKVIKDLGYLGVKIVMLLPLVLLFGGVFSQNVTDDLEIVGSDNHYDYQPYAPPQQPHQEKKFDSEPEMNYPVKTVQRYKDQDGNIRVITSYSNKDDNPLPIYKDKGLVFPIEAPSTQKPDVQFTETRIEPRRIGPKKMEYTAVKSIRFPNNDGELLANEHETSMQDGGGSSYNHQSSYNTKSKKPIPAERSAHVVNQPLQASGTSYVSDVDGDDSVDDGYDNGEYSNDYGHSPHGHGGAYKKKKGTSYSHGHHESKGDKGGKGHKSNEHYEKGHSEKHGHEGEKGGHKEEKGEKVGHHDEANSYAKGHHSNHGGKAHESGSSKGHKKGHKTKGFRTVHHKDEYKKDEVFYDEEHDAGHHKGHGHDHSEHKQTKGGDNKKGHLQSGYKHGHKGSQGDKEHGHSYENSKGYAGSGGHKSHEGHHSHYGKGGGHKEGESHAQGGHGHY